LLVNVTAAARVGCEYDWRLSNGRGLVWRSLFLNDERIVHTAGHMPIRGGVSSFLPAASVLLAAAAEEDRAEASTEVVSVMGEEADLTSIAAAAALDGSVVVWSEWWEKDLERRASALLARLGRLTSDGVRRVGGGERTASLVHGSPPGLPPGLPWV